MPRWGIRYATESGATDLLESRWGTLGEAREACRIRRERRPSIAYRVVRLTTRSDRLQRELDEAQRMLADARAAVGAAWLLEGSLADGIRAKCAMLERLHGPECERRRIVDALLRCTRDDLPAEVDEMVRARVLSRDGRDGMTSPRVVREFAAILATWIARGAK